MKRLVVILFAMVLAYPSPAYGPRWTFKTKKHRHHHKGLKRHEAWRSQKRGKLLQVNPAPLPKSASLVQCASPVEDQGQCGSCWVFSLTGSLRDSLACNGTDTGRLSFSYLLSCATEQSGCNGGDFNAAEHLVTPKGAPSWTNWPYVGVVQSCRDLPVVASSASDHMLGDDQNGVSFRDIAYVVSQLHEAVPVDVAADTAWISYDSGVYNACDQGPSGIDHMVEVVGYDCEGSVSDGNCVFDEKGNLPNGVGTFTVKNSWGPLWGDKGYIVTKATGLDGTKCNAIATNALYFGLAGTKPVTPPITPTKHGAVIAWVIVGLLFVLSAAAMAYKALANPVPDNAKKD